MVAIEAYLSRVLDEARHRQYAFDSRKISYRRNVRMTVTTGQLRYEWRHLMAKLKQRDSDLYERSRQLRPVPHPCFRLVDGPVEQWERRAEQPGLAR